MPSNDGSVTATYSITTGAGITAGTTQTQAGATALTKEHNTIDTCANDNDGVKLAASVIRQIVINRGAKTLKVYPESGDNISGLAADAATTISAGNNVTFAYDGVDEWIMVT